MKNVFKAAILLALPVILFSVESCIKKDSKTAKVIFWWAKPFDDSCIAHALHTGTLYIGPDSVGQLAVGSLYWTYTPTCDEHGTITHTQDVDRYDYPLAIEVAIDPYKYIMDTVLLNPGQCESYELKW